MEKIDGKNRNGVCSKTINSKKTLKIFFGYQIAHSEKKPDFAFIEL